MILDTIEGAEKYHGLNPGFRKAFDFLRRGDLAALAGGRYAIEGDAVYALVSLSEGKGRSESRLEAHRKYIDIQYVVSGEDVIGWKPCNACARPATVYDDARDCIFFPDTPESWCSVVPGRFALFFPCDAHAPLAGSGPLKKIVVKIRAEA